MNYMKYLHEVLETLNTVKAWRFVALLFVALVGIVLFLLPDVITAFSSVNAS